MDGKIDQAVAELAEVKTAQLIFGVALVLIGVSLFVVNHYTGKQQRGNE